MPATKIQSASGVFDIIQEQLGQPVQWEHLSHAAFPCPVRQHCGPALSPAWSDPPMTSVRSTKRSWPLPNNSCKHHAFEARDCLLSNKWAFVHLRAHKLSLTFNAKTVMFLNKEPSQSNVSIRMDKLSDHGLFIAASTIVACDRCTTHCG